MRRQLPGIILIAGIAVLACSTVRAQTVYQMARQFEEAPWWQKTELADQMIQHGDTDAVQETQTLLDSSDRATRVNTAYLLASFGDQRGLPLLIRELSDRSDRQTDMILSNGAPALKRQIAQDHYIAAMLLGKLGPRARAAVPALIEATKDEHDCLPAAIALGNIGDESAIPALQEMLEASPKQRVWAAGALTRLGEDFGLAVLETIAGQSGDWVERRHAIEELAALARPRSLDIVRATLSDSNVNVRISAIRSLGQFGMLEDRTLLAGHVDDEEPSTVNAPTTIGKEAGLAMQRIAARLGNGSGNN